MEDRRSFLHHAALLSAGAFIPAESWLYTSRLLHKLGIQLFSVPKLLDSNLEGTLAMLANIGFKEIELYGPYSFSTEKAKKQWEAIIPMVGFKGSGFYGKSVETITAILKKHGFTVPSMHTDLDTLANNMGPMAEAAHHLGAKYLVLPSIPDDHRKSADDYKRTAELFNKIGAEAKSYGVRFGYHNHGYGLHVEDGRMPMDTIFEQTDSELVFFEMDVYWTTAGGADPVELLKKHKGRYTMLHIKDMKELKRFSGDGGDASQWIELFPYMSSAGEGVLDLPNILQTAKKYGVEHFIVEQDLVASAEVALKKSYDYLSALPRK